MATSKSSGSWIFSKSDTVSLFYLPSSRAGSPLARQSPTEEGFRVSGQHRVTVGSSPINRRRAPCRSVGRSAEGRGGGVDGHEAVTIRHAGRANSSRFQPRARLPLGATGNPLLAFCGQILRSKQISCRQFFTSFGNVSSAETQEMGPTAAPLPGSSSSPPFILGRV